MTAAGDFNPTRFIAGFQRMTAAADNNARTSQTYVGAVCSTTFALKACEMAMNKSMLEASKIAP